MKPNSKKDTDPLIKSLIAPRRTSWKKRSVALLTIVLIIFILYLIVSRLSPSLQINNNHKNNIIAHNIETHAIGSDPFMQWNECNDIQSPPELIAYHVHALFEGTDAQSVSFAYQIYHEFIEYILPSMSACTFAHSKSAIDQNEVCYFPNTWQESDDPIPSNFIFQTANYAFYIPPFYVQKTITFWMQKHDSIHYVIHSVSGCQLNDHTKWLMADSGYDASQLVTDNLLCCHYGPALCSCDIVQYQMNDDNQCLSVQFSDDDNNEVSFMKAECESADQRNVGSWREMIYDSEQNWFQIENYGDVNHPMYLCLGVVDGGECEIGAEIKLLDCGNAQDIDNNVWISPLTQIMYDQEANQMKLLGCDREDLCVNIVDDGDALELNVATCVESTVFIQRHFFP